MDGKSGSVFLSKCSESGITSDGIQQREPDNGFVITVRSEYVDSEEQHGERVGDTDGGLSDAGTICVPTQPGICGATHCNS